MRKTSRKRAPRPKRLGAILVRVNDEELARIKAAAGYEPLASWARRMLLEVAKPIRGTRGRA